MLRSLWSGETFRRCACLPEPRQERRSRNTVKPPLPHLELPTAQPDLAPKGAPVAAANDAPRFQRFVGASERPPRLPQAGRRRRRLAAAFYCSCSFRLKAFWLLDVSAVFARAASLMKQQSVSVHRGLLSYARAAAASAAGQGGKCCWRQVPKWQELQRARCCRGRL